MFCEESLAEIGHLKLLRLANDRALTHSGEPMPRYVPSAGPSESAYSLLKRSTKTPGDRIDGAIRKKLLSPWA
ncbi:MAG: hypothetical protein Q9180_001355 [Flavoplaca navasiana]